MKRTGIRLVERSAAVALLLALGALGIFLWKHPARQTTPPPPQDTLRRDLAQNQGRWYRNGETDPFTGWIVDYYPGGALLSRCQISNGLLNGVSETWYTNGQVEVREHFKDGVSHGQREKWYENGAKLSLAMIADAKVIGTFRSWYDNGHLSEQIEMKVGRPDGIALAYYPSGFLKAETTVHDGQVQQRKVWNDGERKSIP